MDTYVFDTSAILAFFEGERGATTVQNLISEVESNRVDGVINPVTVTELFQYYAKNQGVREAYDIIVQLKLSKIRILPMGEEIALKAGHYRSKGIPLADASIAATAKILRAKLVADDKHLRNLDIDLFKFR